MREVPRPEPGKENVGHQLFDRVFPGVERVRVEVEGFPPFEFPEPEGVLNEGIAQSGYISRIDPDEAALCYETYRRLADVLHHAQQSVSSAQVAAAEHKQDEAKRHLEAAVHLTKEAERAALDIERQYLRTIAI